MADTPPQISGGDSPAVLQAMLAFQLLAGADEAIEQPEAAIPSNQEPQTQPEAEQQPEVDLQSQILQPAAAADWLAGVDDVPSLEAFCAEFDGCALKKTATNMVFADGNPNAPIMLVGEAPGADEDRHGKPFVGVSGQLLDRMLGSIGLDRSGVYITNIVLWRPPGNRTPTTEENALFLPIIRRHIELINPKILVALGGSAAKSLLGTSTGILKLRGRFYDYDGCNYDRGDSAGGDSDRSDSAGGDYGRGDSDRGDSAGGAGRKIPLLPTLHPAYLLRSPGQKPLAWQDLRRLKHKLAELGLKD